MLFCRFEDPDGNTWLLQQWPEGGYRGAPGLMSATVALGGADGTARDPLSLVFGRWPTRPAGRC